MNMRIVCPIRRRVRAGISPRLGCALLVLLVALGCDRHLTSDRPSTSDTATADTSAGAGDLSVSTDAADPWSDDDSTPDDAPTTDRDADAIDLDEIGSGDVDAGLGAPDGDVAKDGDDPEPLKAGVATVEITPIVGVPLAGFGGGKRRDLDVDKLLIGLEKNCVDPDPSTPYVMFNPSEGVLDPLRAKVLAVQSGARTLVIVGLDLIGANQELLVDLSIALKPYGVESRDIMVTATHTHSGPGALSIRRFWEMAAADCFNQGVYDALKAKVIDAAKTALEGRVPVAVGWRSGTIEGVQRNRRGKTGHFDNTLTVMHLRRLDDTPLATVVSLPIHPTALGESNMRFSSDLTGAVERSVEKQLGGAAIFLQKPEGDVSPVLPSPGVEGMLALAETIAARALELMPTSYSTSLPLSTAQLFYDFGQPFMREGCAYPGAFDLCGAFPDFELQLELTETWFPQRIPITVARLGPLLLVGLPGEPTTSVADAIRTALIDVGESEIWLLALVNEHMGYVTTSEEYIEGGYESIATLFGATTAETLKKAVLATLATLD
ncbi:MAG: neutral/alkaline non-lysosomal ceramidase N-terminal domain-containing protein [Myxococcales bacterium]|nr:neutral/alkaline non-lysosomal ceramidase N-terminal domain-containing protein [Myxococcales bacterium]